MTRPSRCNKRLIRYMLGKGKAWQDMIQAGKLSRRHIWFMLEKQFAPRVFYGLCTISALYKELAECLMGIYYKIHPQGGICRTARRGICRLDRGFYGVSCPHPAIECLVAQLNKLLMHYGNQSCLGLKMQTSMELLVIELGMSLQPFQVDYVNCQKWVTHLWMKSV